ncbi:MAG: universal stress protein [Polyangiaceae bacterium]
MSTTKKIILVPTDFSESAESALAYAITLAKSTDHSIVLMYAYQTPTITPYDGPLVANGDVLTAIEVGVKQGLAEVLAKHKDCGIEIRTCLEHGDPKECVLRAAKEVGADLIVMGTHGRHGVARLLLGSVTESVVRTASIPVLTVRAALASS